MTLPAITIAIPVYNGADTLAETMLSALTQLSINDELIVVDNDSTDQTPNIVKKYQSTYSNLRYFKNSRFYLYCS